MRLTTRDIGKLQWPLIGTLLMGCLAILPAWWSNAHVVRAEAERNAAEQRKTTAEQRLRQVRTEEQELRERAARYLQMQRAGVTGREQRLEWTELIERLRQELGLPGVRYEFGIRKPLDQGGSPEYDYFASPMRMQMRLVHEEDLLHFLRRLQTEAPALVMVSSCTLKPLPAATGSPDIASLGAECDLRWITAQAANSTP